MDFLWILLILIAILIVTMVCISWICFSMAFYAPKHKRNQEEFPIPEGEVYEPYRETMVNWIREIRKMPAEEHTIVSFDGLSLYGKYYEYAPDAPIELMMHGYRGNAERDLCGGVQRCFALGHSALIVDQRCAGKSGGRVITFGVREHRDCLSWVEYMRCHFGPEVKIILTGISMGASTVLMAAGQELPENVIGVLADCGYTSAREVIHSVIRGMHLPVDLAYPFVRLGARLFGGFDPEDGSAIQALKTCRVPVIFCHGDADELVPCHMSRENYNACASRKKLVIIPGAGHGLSFLVDPDTYLSELSQFFHPKKP